MKILVVFIGICAIMFYFFYPPVNSERLCYENSERNLNQISVNMLNQRSSKDTKCRESSDVISALESCIADATKSSTIAPYANDTIGRVVALLRPYAKNLWILKGEHNSACADFFWYQLP